MIPAAVARGSSFKGLAAYLGGSKKNDHRAVWSATQNIGTEDIHMAARLMAATAMDADAIKRANGWDGRGRRTTKRPVYHWIMSWPEDMSPDATHQEDAARDLLKATGFDEAQAIFVGHDDNGKTHVHVVINLINPETGKQFSRSNDHYKAQAWALDYCKANGIDVEKIAPNRAKNAEKRKRAKERGGLEPGETLEGNKRLSRSEWNKMRKALLERQALERSDLHEDHASDRAFAKIKIEARKKADKAAFLKEHAHQKSLAQQRNRPYWRDLFQRQRQESAEARNAVEKAIKTHRRAHSFLGRVLSVLPFRKNAEQAQAELSLAKMKLAELLKQQERERYKLSRKLSGDVFDRTLEALPRREPIDLADMKERHARDWQELKERQAEERKDAGVKSAKLTSGQKAKARDNADRQKERDREERRRMKERAKELERSERRQERERTRAEKQRQQEQDKDRER
ncbi:MAG: relaxase/mobilization nuclease domain-containing protein [Parasphingopyxis sp.]|uniref:relaxase/mobilization nuclease domain-containing protein n=1 Tax=Parasphingopyxis sp. TaxID=1920299 RepID=UPI003F9F0DDA